jgi:hypothetical protein
VEYGNNRIFAITGRAKEGSYHFSCPFYEFYRTLNIAINHFQFLIDLYKRKWIG